MLAEHISNVLGENPVDPTAEKTVPMPDIEKVSASAVSVLSLGS